MKPNDRSGRKGPTATLAAAVAVAALLATAGPAQAGDTTPRAQLERFAAEAGQAPDALRGRQFFTEVKGGDWSCSTCHQDPPLTAGRHASTGKPIDPLAPAANPDAFTSTRQVDKWFRRNCKDVLGRECSAGEKADVIAWLIGLR